jgi:hypothetical protein
MPVARDMRRLIHAGYLGGTAHGSIWFMTSATGAMPGASWRENHCALPPGGPLQSHQPWHWKIVSTCRVRGHAARGFTSRFLESIGETGIIDEPV